METPKVGRPKKVENLEHPEVAETFNKFAIGTYQDPKTLNWHVVKVGFNPVTQSTGNFEVVATEATRGNISDSFKITVANLDIVG